MRSSRRWVSVGKTDADQRDWWSTVGGRQLPSKFDKVFLDDVYAFFASRQSASYQGADRAACTHTVLVGAWTSSSERSVLSWRSNRSLVLSSSVELRARDDCSRPSVKRSRSNWRQQRWTRRSVVWSYGIWRSTCLWRHCRERECR